MDWLTVLAGRVSSLDAVLLGLAYLIYKIVTTKTAIKRATVTMSIKILATMGGAAVIMRLLVMLHDWKII